MNNITDVQKMKVCSCCEEEKPASNEYFHTNKKNGRIFLYSVCKVCKRKKYTKKNRLYNDCLYCGKSFEAIRNDKKYCSGKCATYYNKYHEYKPKPKQPQIINKCINCDEGTVKGRYKYCEKCKNKIINRNCARCNNVFSVKISKLNKFCSDKCRNKDSIRKKKIYDEMNNVFVSRKEIFIAENYKCKSCGCNTDKNFGYIKGTQIPKPTSPTIDHIVPLNHGGTHTLKNVQLLCYKCNHEKQDGFLQEGEQLKMF